MTTPYAQEYADCTRDDHGDVPKEVSRELARVEEDDDKVEEVRGEGEVKDELGADYDENHCDGPFDVARQR